MTRLFPILAAALALLSACGGSQTASNGTDDVVVLGNSDEIVMPSANGADAGAAAANNTEATTPAVNLSPDGLTLVLPSGASRHVAFGTPRAAVSQMATAALGTPIETGENQECGAGALAFANHRGGLSLYFQDEMFVGWDLDGRDGGRFSTFTGIGIGSTRRQLDQAGSAAIEDSTLGIEFTSEGVSGLLSDRSPQAEVTNLWAGATCIAR
jgi:hypothetical protein